jgi:hypothetical protein
MQVLGRISCAIGMICAALLWLSIVLSWRSLDFRMTPLSSIGAGGESLGRGISVVGGSIAGYLLGRRLDNQRFGRVSALLASGVFLIVIWAAMMARDSIAAENDLYKSSGAPWGYKVGWGLSLAWPAAICGAVVSLVAAIPKVEAAPPPAPAPVAAQGGEDDLNASRRAAIIALRRYRIAKAIAKTRPAPKPGPR